MPPEQFSKVTAGVVSGAMLDWQNISQVSFESYYFCIFMWHQYPIVWLSWKFILEYENFMALSAKKVPDSWVIRISGEISEK